MDADRMVSAYVAIREEKRRIKAESEGQIAALDAHLDMLSEALLAQCKDINADSIKTDSGTAMRSLHTKYWTGDWESMYSFIKEHDALDLLERKIQQKNMGQFLDDNKGVLPPGLNIEQKYTIVIRRKRSVIK